MKIANFNIIETIHETETTLVYRAIKDGMPQAVTLKTLKGELPDPKLISCIKNEFDLMSGVSSDGIIKPLELVTYTNNIALIMEEVVGVSLKSLIQSAPLSIELFFKYSFQLIKVMGQLHNSSIICRGINPGNIIINTQDKTLKIIEFGIPSKTTKIKGEFDTRSDIYFLGLVFFEMLTSEPPLVTNAPSLDNPHLNKKPQDPKIKNPLIPESLGKIILKAIEKKAKDRYQAISDLEKDLYQCFEKTVKGHSSIALEVDKQLRKTKPNPSKYIFGREFEIHSLENTINNLPNELASFILLKGPSGIGKTAIIEEIQKKSKNKAFFIYGKYDLGIDIPYAGISMALTSLLNQWLDSSEKVDQLRTEIYDHLGTDLTLITDLVPELKKICGVQQSNNLSDHQTKFKQIYCEFISLFAKESRPLILLLDDLQWADSGSIDLIKYMLSKRSLYKVLIIGSCDSDATMKEHYLQKSLDKMKAENLRFHEMPIDPLQIEGINKFLANSLCTQPNKTASLSHIMQNKTRGNPLFLSQMLTYLVNHNFISYERRLGSWSWQEENIEEKNIPNSLNDLIARNFSRLSSDMMEKCQIAACLGTKFDLKTLAMVLEQSMPRVLSSLMDAIRDGLIISPKFNYIDLLHQDHASLNRSPSFFLRFSHDRMRQAAYETISFEKRSEIHLKIGLTLLNLQKQGDNNIYAPLAHLNKGIPAKPKEPLDYASLIKSSQELSSEKTLKGLVTALMQNLMDNLEATRGLLFLLRRETSELYCEADIDLVNQTHQILNSFHLNDKSPCLVGMIRYAMRTMASIVLNKVNQSQFATGGYFNQAQPKSVICVPIISGRMLLGVVYLENRTKEAAFTEEKLKIAEIISAQAAVSFENVKLYGNLEQKVLSRTKELAERTNDIKKILQNLKQGIFTITKDLKIHPEYSSYLHTIFQTDEVAHIDATEFLLKNATLESDAISKIKNSLITMIGDELINFGINQHLLPKEIILLPDKKILEVDWQPITNKDKIVEKMLVIIRDVSELRSIRGKAKEKEIELTVIGELLNNKPESLAFFFQNSKDLLHECKRKARGKQISRDDLNSIFRNVHTIKGNSRIFGLSLVSESAHIAEAFIRDINVLSPLSFALQNLESEINDIEANLGVYESLFKEKLQSFNQTKSPELAILLEAEKILHSTKPFENAENSVRACLELTKIFRKRTLISLHQILDDLIESLPKLAIELKKPAPYLDIEHGHLPLNISQITMLKDVFMHCVRNCLDHGIEPASVRIRNKKSPVGKINISYRQFEDNIHFFIRDDGKGLNLKSLREKGINEGLITDQDDDKAIANLIFHPGLSLASEVTKISGRGFGMEAVKEFLSNIGGFVEVKFIDGNCDFGFRLFELVFSVPIEKQSADSQVA